MPAKSFQRWIDVIKDTVLSRLIPALKPLNMSIELGTFKECINGSDPFNLANVPDFNSLIAQSQKHNVPIFALTDKQIEQSGVILEKMKESRDGFENLFSNMATEIHNLIEKSSN